MVVRLSAATCGVVILFVYSSVATARSELLAVRSYAAATFVGTATMYNP